MSLQDAAAIIDGVRPEGAEWADGYPADATLIAAALLIVADREGRDLGPWTVFQVLHEGRVVAGMGFIEGPDAHGAVRIGFSETEEARQHNAVVPALRELIARGRAHGATLIRAEASEPHQIRMLTAAGMREVGLDFGVHLFEA